MSGRPTRVRNSAWRTQSVRSSRVRRAFGMRAKDGELVDHALDVVDLADDRVGALVEDVLAFDDVPAVAALQALGRKLDRRQRVLDLVRDAPRDVGPGGAALRGDEIADVVERDHAALVGALGSPVTRTLRSRSRPSLMSVACA